MCTGHTDQDAVLPPYAVFQSQLLHLLRRFPPPVQSLSTSSRDIQIQVLRWEHYARIFPNLEMFLSLSL